MKLAVALLALLFVAFLAGCTSTTTSKGENQQTQATPAPTQTQQLNPQEENKELNDFDSGLISEDDNIEIGEIV